MSEAIERTFTLHVPSSTENLVLIREFVTSIATRAGLDQSDVAKLELAVDEACANVIEHAYQHDSSKEVTVRAIVDDEALRIQVVDTGRGFDPMSVNAGGNSDEPWQRSACGNAVVAARRVRLEQSRGPK